MHHPTDRILHSTVFIIPVVEDWLDREIAQWVEVRHRSDDIWYYCVTRVPKNMDPPQNMTMYVPTYNAFSGSATDMAMHVYSISVTILTSSQNGSAILLNSSDDLSAIASL